jgi:hypothetical protein
LNGFARYFTQKAPPADWALHGDKSKVHVGDFDNDGKDDFFRQEKGSWDDDGDLTTQTFLSKL